MRYSVSLFPYDRWGSVAALREAVSIADQVRIDTVCLPEHIVMPVRDGVDPLSVVWHDNFVLAAHLAASTRRIRFAFKALVVPYRHPVAAAKLIATVDTVSDGRLTIVAGTGWMRREFRTLGVPFEERGAMTDEYLRAMRVLWTDDNPRFEGRYVSFGDLAFQPRCVQKPHVPVLAGGDGTRAIRRAIELCDGWAPMVVSDEALAAGIAEIKAGVIANGGGVDHLQFCTRVSVGPRDSTSAAAMAHVTGAAPETSVVALDVDAIATRSEQLASLGVTEIDLSFAWEDPADFIRQVEWLGHSGLVGQGSP